MKKMLAILALCVSACDSIEMSEKGSILNVDSTTNIREHDSTSSVAQNDSGLVATKAASLLPETSHIK